LLLAAPVGILVGLVSPQSSAIHLPQLIASEEKRAVDVQHDIRPNKRLGEMGLKEMS